MKPQGWKRTIRVPHRSAAYRARSSVTGQNGQAAKEKMSWKARCRENTCSFQLMEKCFSLDLPFLRGFRIAAPESDHQKSAV
jgi:hypothetical protein